MVKVGKYKVIHFTHLLQMTGDDSYVSFRALGEDIEFRFRFLVDEGNKDQRLRRVESGPDPENEQRGLVTFTNWHKENSGAVSQPLVAAFVEPEDGVSPSCELLIAAFISYSDEMYSVALQFMVEARP
ncbi:hypothetical protein HIV01_003480 [Lysobacter arenosi]|uniref:Uncharacterized protein n=1 Tax=Lysobacter arenosi TaxID=2795387 RepID=A0ABX7RE89_9GAMM|nr:hypothetical protein [Lysobacter arenosi]QSX75606.1 hypothetical protein HIV01_003480 [Lysobacter arenosi]